MFTRYHPLAYGSLGNSRMSISCLSTSDSARLSVSSPKHSSKKTPQTSTIPPSSYNNAEAPLLSQDIPLVLISDQDTMYQRICIEHARRYGNHVMVIDPRTMHTLSQQKEEYQKKYHVFTTHYKHMSRKPREFELFCFKRWFILAGYMRRHKIAKLYHIDSDVLLSTSTTEMEATYNFEQKEAALCIPLQQYNENRWLASAHVCMWTYPILAEFCNFMIDVYMHNVDILKENIAYHHRYAIRHNGISDMSLLYLFYHRHGKRINNLLLPQDKRCCDYGIVSRDNFEQNEYKVGYTYYKYLEQAYIQTLPAKFQSHQTWIRSKKLYITNGVAHGINIKARARIRFDALHFAEREKKLMQYTAHTMRISQENRLQQYPFFSIRSLLHDGIIFAWIWRYIALVGSWIRDTFIYVGVRMLRMFPFLRTVKKLLIKNTNNTHQ